MAAVKVRAQLRKETGKGAARSLRRRRLIPAVFYGPATDSTPLALEYRELQKILSSGAGENALVDLKIENGTDTRSTPAMIKEIQRDPVKEVILHVDFCAVSMHKELTLEVPLTLTGAPVGVAEGGILQQVRRSIEISCLPDRIPEALELDVSNLAIGESLHVSDLNVPGGIEVLAEERLTIATVLPPAGAEEIEAETLEAAGEEVEEAAEGTEDQGAEE
jgi:large subunit ribosomal protein L25